MIMSTTNEVHVLKAGEEDCKVFKIVERNEGALQHGDGGVNH